jgi:hypothetical protein
MEDPCMEMKGSTAVVHVEQCGYCSHEQQRERKLVVKRRGVERDWKYFCIQLKSKQIIVDLYIKRLTPKTILNQIKSISTTNQSTNPKLSHS